MCAQHTVTVYIRETSLDSNPKSTQIFIKYMHDIVLQISFLDINSQNWITGSHLKLLQKSLKIQYIFQKFLCMANGPDIIDFLIPKNLCSGPFLIFFSNMMDQKNAPSQKICSHKKSIFTCPSTTWRNIWYFLTPVSYSYNCLPELQTAAGNPILRIDV